MEAAMLDEVHVLEAEGAREGSGKKKKRKDKVRSAWIAFAGRIAAQILGAVATVVLGLLVLHKYSGPEKHQTDREASGAAHAVVEAPRAIDELSLAVLPLEDFSVGHGDDFFADSMTEMLITSLSKIDGLHVVSRTSSIRFKNQRKPLRDIGRELGALWIVEGAIARVGDRVRITAQLIDTAIDVHVWAETYDRPLADVLAIQMEVARAIAGAVEKHVNARVQRDLSRGGRLMPPSWRGQA
jgi:TolB-like protein